MLPLVTSIAASSSVLVLALWYAQSRSRHDLRLRTLMEPQRMLAEQSDPFSQRVAFPIANSMVNLLLALLPTALIGRARRSFLLSIGLLLVGLIVVGAVVVYRASQGSGGPSGADYVIASLKIPSGAEIVSAVAADGQLTVTYRAGPMTSVRIFDGKSGEMIREIPVVSE